jgi:hypothetical protein
MASEQVPMFQNILFVISDAAEKFAILSLARPCKFVQNLRANAVACSTQVSISPTFYEQLLGQNPFAKKLQTQIVST